jgi:hypothetical protein
MERVAASFSSMVPMQVPGGKDKPQDLFLQDYLLTHWKLFRALAFPGFFRSTTLESLVNIPAVAEAKPGFRKKTRQTQIGASGKRKRCPSYLTSVAVEGWDQRVAELY